MLVDTRGWSAPPWTRERFLPVQRTGCSWMLVDGVLSHGPMSRMTCAAHRMPVDARGGGALPWTHERFLPVLRGGVNTHAPMSDS